MMILASRFWLPPDISTHGADVDLLIDFLHYFMVFLFVAWGIFMAVCLWRFRQRSGHRAVYHPIKGKVSKYGEILVVIVEVVLLVFFSMPVWARTKDRDQFPKPDEAMEIRVVAQQFAWNVHYPGPDGVFGPRAPALTDETLNPIGLDRSHPAAKDDVTTINIMHIPVNQKVIVRLSSKDVIHSFWIPMLRVKQDAVPGMNIPIWFEANSTSAQVRALMTRTVSLPDSDGQARFLRTYKHYATMKPYGDHAAGTTITAEHLAALHSAGAAEVDIAPREPIEIHCAQLCGLQHYSMRGFLTVESQEDFDAWLKEQAQFLPGDEDDFFD